MMFFVKMPLQMQVKYLKIYVDCTLARFAHNGKQRHKITLYDKKPF